MMNRPMKRAALAALLMLTACCGTDAVDVKAERSAFDLVTGATVDTAEGKLAVDWLSYLRSDERVPAQQLQLFEDFVLSWDLRIRAGEGEAAAREGATR